MKVIAALCGGVSLLAIGSAAYAQGAASAGPTAHDPTTLDSVVVTGSHIVRNGYSAPTPVTVAPIEQLLDTVPSSIPNALNRDLPQFAGSTGSAGNSTTGGTASVFGGNYLNLRNFGAIRTLILLDGRRVPATAINGQVDANVLPQMLVERVDVVTGGASAVYGSDAVTGVVNFVLDKHFNGLKLVAQAGTSTYGDANSNRIGVAAGANVTDRGHFIFSAERSQDFGIPTHENRSWSAAVPDYVGTGSSAANPFVLINDARLNSATYGGLITKVAGGASAGLVNQQFVGGGTLGAFNPGTPTATSTINIGGDGAYYKGLSLSGPSITTQGFGRFEYELTKDIIAYAQLGYAENELPGQHSLNSPPTPLTIFSGNPYLPASVQSQLGASPAANFTVNRLNRDLAQDATQYQKIDALQFTTGLSGS
ncbi:MAG: hypothetical protein JWO72_1500, partial [Caulobacteraceae bacterium]|nr:hypothetical protein [Caulobacteraceae bacterium]